MGVVAGAALAIVGSAGVEAVTKALEPPECKTWATELQEGFERSKWELLEVTAGASAQITSWLDPTSGDIHTYAIVDPRVSTEAESDGFRDIGGCTLPNGQLARRMFRLQPAEQASAPSGQSGAAEAK